MTFFFPALLLVNFKYSNSQHLTKNNIRIYVERFQDIQGLAVHLKKIC